MSIEKPKKWIESSPETRQRKFSSKTSSISLKARNDQLKILPPTTSPHYSALFKKNCEENFCDSSSFELDQKEDFEFWIFLMFLV